MRVSRDYMTASKEAQPLYANSDRKHRKLKVVIWVLLKAEGLSANNREGMR